MKCKVITDFGIISFQPLPVINCGELANLKISTRPLSLVLTTKLTPLCIHTLLLQYGIA